MKTGLFLLACSLGITCSIGPEDMVERIALTKAWAICVGPETVKRWELQVRDAADRCNALGRPLVAGGIPTTTYGIPSTTIPAGYAPTFQTTGTSTGVSPALFNIYEYVPAVYQDPSFVYNRPVRGKRQISQAANRRLFSVQRLLQGEDELKSRVANFSCILQSLNLVDRSGQLKFQEMAQTTASMNLDGDLKRDLLKVLNDCAALSTCTPSAEEASLIPVDLQRAYAFFQCIRLKRQIACIKQDIRTYIRNELPQETRGSFNLEDVVNRVLQVKLAEALEDETTLLS